VDHLESRLRNKDQNSEAYGSLQSYKVGESFGVEYGEKEESFVKKEGADAGKTINFTRRTIYKILPLVPNPTALPAKSTSPAEHARGEAPTRSQGHPDAFGRRLGIQGHINALLGNTKVFPTTSVEGVVALAIRVEDEAERQLAQGPQAMPNGSPLPVIQQDEPMIGDDIPF
jgi:hypothetical protein